MTFLLLIINIDILVMKVLEIQSVNLVSTEVYKSVIFSWNYEVILISWIYRFIYNSAIYIIYNDITVVFIIIV